MVLQSHPRRARPRATPLVPVWTAGRIAEGRFRLSIAFAVALWLVVWAPAASATFPGQNGKVASVSCPFSGRCTIRAVDQVSNTPVAGDVSSDSWPDWSADGQQLAFVRYSSGEPELWKVNTDGTGQTPLCNSATCPGTPVIQNPTWDPDGSRLAFSRPNDIFVIGADGNGIQTITTDTLRGLDPAWSPDGEWIAFQYYDLVLNTRGLARMRPNGTDFTPLKILTFTDPTSETYGQADWSPDGTRIAYSHSIVLPGQTKGSSRIETMDSSGGDTQAVSEFEPPGECGLARSDLQPVWTPDGTKLTWIANVCAGDSPSAEQRIANPDGTDVKLLPGLPGRVESWQPCFSDCHGLVGSEPPPPPDSDLDGIPDDQDQCPFEYAPGTSNGCLPTDTDGDGVPDPEDACPEVPGQASNGGCPPLPACSDGRDNDGDGAIDFGPDRGCSDELDGDETGEPDQSGGEPFGECAIYQTGINGCVLQPGDILVWRSSAPDFFEEFLGDTFWSHAAIVVGYLNMDDRDAGRELVIADSQPGLDDREVALRDITDTPFAAPDPSIPFVRAYRLEGVSASDRQRAATRTLGHLLGSGGAGLSHNQSAQYWQAANFSYTRSPAGTGPDAFYCSGLVWWAYHEVGVDINGADSLLNPITLGDHAYVTPDDLISDEERGPRDLGADRPVAGTSIGLYGAGAAAGTAGASRRGPTADLLLIDTSGRRTGRAPNGKTYHQIPGAVWRHTSRNESVTAVDPAADWKIILTGRRSGRYTLVWRSYRGGSSAGIALSGVSKRGRVERYVARALKPGAACVVPNVKGKRLANARRLIRSAHCRLGPVRRASGRSGPVRVRRQSPKPGVGKPRGSPVRLLLGPLGI